MPRTGLSAAQIRDRAVAVATEAIRREGFERVRLVDVAREMGVSHVALYKHFADKTQLLDAVSERWLAEIDATLESIAHRGRRSATRRIRDVFLTLHQMKRERMRSDPELYHAFDATVEQEKPFVERHLKVLDRLVIGLVREAQTSGDIAPGSPHAIAAVLDDAMAAFTHPKLVAAFVEEEREAQLARVLDAVLRGLR